MSFFTHSFWKWGNDHWVCLGSLGRSMRLTWVKTRFFFWPPLAPTLMDTPVMCQVPRNQDEPRYSFNNAQWVMVFPVCQCKMILMSSFTSLWEMLRRIFAKKNIHNICDTQGKVQGFFHLKDSGLFKRLKIWRLAENSLWFHFLWLKQGLFPPQLYKLSKILVGCLNLLLFLGTQGQLITISHPCGWEHWTPCWSSCFF